MAYSAFLPDRAVLAVSGDEACDFLQGLITNDMRKLEPANSLFAALLSPQGRFLFDFFITERDGKFLLDTQKDRLPDLLKRLSMYRLRSKVQFEALPQMKIAAVWGMPVLPIGYDDPRLASLGWRIMAEQMPVLDAKEGDYERHRLSLGVPEGAKDLVIDRSIILEYGYDELNAVDFAKGCYIGQEVTARSKRRATLRKFIHCVRSDSPLPPKGTVITVGGREVGVMASAQGNIGLAHLRVEEVQRAHQEKTPLSANDVPLAASLPSWCRTSFAEGILTS